MDDNYICQQCNVNVINFRSSRRNGNKVSGSVVQDDGEGHLIFSIGDILQNRYILSLINFLRNSSVSFVLDIRLQQSSVKVLLVK